MPSPGTGEIWIITDRPLEMPTTIEDVPVQIKPAPPHLPPPPGVIVLKPDGIQEHLPDVDACPEGYKEERLYRWRFCQSLYGVPQPIPALMAPPIAGIPHDKAEAIFKRHVDEIRALPGVTGAGLGAEGITIYTSHPELALTEIEGLPVKTAPPRRFRPTNHTSTTKTNPFHRTALIFWWYSELLRSPQIFLY